jgi:hypothetical protein
VARVVLGVVPGFRQDGDSMRTLLDHFDEVMDSDRVVAPAGSFEELAYFAVDAWQS